jgi:hypothetical protein
MSSFYLTLKEISSVDAVPLFPSRFSLDLSGRSAIRDYARSEFPLEDCL